MKLDREAAENAHVPGHTYAGISKCNLDAVTQIATGYSTTTFQFDQVETMACAVLSKFHLVDPDPARAGVLI
jgi:hypothetical protein